MGVYAQSYAGLCIVLGWRDWPKPMEEIGSYNLAERKSIAQFNHRLLEFGIDIIRAGSMLFFSSDNCF